MGYTGYDPAAQAIREARGEPYATGADDPDYWNPVDPPQHEAAAA